MMLKYLLVLLLLGQAYSQNLLTYNALSLVDLAQTEYGLSEGYAEGNPLMPNKFAMYSIKIGTSISLYYISKQIKNKRHKKILYWAINILQFAVVVHNYRVLR